MQYEHKRAAWHVVLALGMLCRSIHAVHDGTWHQTTICRPAVVRQ